MKAENAIMNFRIPIVLLACLLSGTLLFGQTPGPVRITLEQAIDAALQQNHSLLANRTTVQQSHADEITANIRPNPTLFTDWQYLPLFHPEEGLSTYLHDSTQADLGLAFTIERGAKRKHRSQAATDTTAQIRSQVEDNERTLTFQVASAFINVQLAESVIDFAQQNLKSFQNTVDVSQAQFAAGAISENDNLKVKLQLLQFQTDLRQAQLARTQGLADLRLAMGYESVPADFDVTGQFEYQPAALVVEALQAAATQNRPDLRAALLGVTAANSQLELARANGKQDFTVSGNYSHAAGNNTMTFVFSVPLPVYDRNQGEIEKTHHVILQAEETAKALTAQVRTDVADAFAGVQANDAVVQFYRSGNLETAQRSRDISEYAYQRGGQPLFDFLDAERSYRATQLAYRQALAAYLISLEEVRQAVGTRSLP
jgi:cobalt-zinc-cadmium efflux system outer membrane protein